MLVWNFIVPLEVDGNDLGVTTGLRSRPVVTPKSCCLPEDAVRPGQRISRQGFRQRLWNSY